ncbi:MAG: SDR family NAD(P)-dependent oxidoreductase [Bryobacterales bacterium]
MSSTLITGGSRGIGRALVEEFARAGHPVGFTFNQNHEAADDLVAILAEEGFAARAYACDVRDFEAVQALVGQVEQDLGSNQDADQQRGVRNDGAFFRMSAEAWKDVLDTNLTGVFHCCRAVGPGMIRRGGTVLNITSAAGIVGIPGQVNYCAAKAGVIGLTKARSQRSWRGWTSG